MDFLPNIIGIMFVFEYSSLFLFLPFSSFQTFLAVFFLATVIHIKVVEIDISSLAFFFFKNIY